MDYPKISLAAARVNAGMTQRQASQELHIDLRTLQNYESGRTVPNWYVVRRMEEVYQFPADFLNFTRKSALSVDERASCHE